MSKGREIHHKVEHAREKEQNPIKSLKFVDEAIKAYQQESDFRGLAEVLQSRSSAYKLLFQQTEDPVFLVLAKHSSLAGIEIAKKLDDPSSLCMPYRGIAKIHEQLKEHGKASEYFQKAIEIFQKNPPPENNRPAVLSDMKAHLHANQYLSGSKTAYKKLLEDIKKLEADTQEPRYNLDVWLSGAHMRAAQILAEDNPEKSQEHLQKAKKIIDSNNELVLRAQQWEKLNQKLSSS